MPSPFFHFSQVSTEPACVWLILAGRDFPNAEERFGWPVTGGAAATERGTLVSALHLIGTLVAVYDASGDYNFSLNTRGTLTEEESAALQDQAQGRLSTEAANRRRAA